jgi:hypothetical protein
MSRPAVEVADILRAHEARFLDKNRSWLSFQQLTVLRAIARCRTAALGGHLDSCSGCGRQAISYNSCRNRHCPKCQTQARQRWLAAREREVLGVPYFHVVFTLPQDLNPLCQRNQTVLYNLLFRSSAAAMLEVAADPKRTGWFTPRPPSAARRRSSAISAATLIALRSATIDWSLTKRTKSHFAGKITRAATSIG